MDTVAILCKNRSSSYGCSSVGMLALGAQSPGFDPLAPHKMGVGVYARIIQALGRWMQKDQTF